jgi:steroid delta-isomerase-like uncharacterized protein
MPTPEENKKLAQKFMDEVFGKKNLEYVEEALTDDSIDHTPMPGMPDDKKGAIEAFQRMFAMSEDMSYEVHHIIAGGDRVAIHATVRGTDTGGFMGAPATNKPFEMGGIDIVRVDDDGKFAEHWGIYDAMGVMQQLGLIPTPGS